MKRHEYSIQATPGPERQTLYTTTPRRTWGGPLVGNGLPRIESDMILPQGMTRPEGGREGRAALRSAARAAAQDVRSPLLSLLALQIRVITDDTPAVSSGEDGTAADHAERRVDHRQ
jgi:hypothetical protein